MAAFLKQLPTEVPDALFGTLGSLCAPAAPLLARGRTLLRAQLPADGVAWVDGWLAQNRNVHARRLPLMDPYEVVILAFAYIFVVLFLNLVMRVLPSPKETRLMKLFQLFHNTFLTLLSLYM
eukprot:EG_transcript_52200